MSKQGNLDSFFGVPKEKRVQKQVILSFAPQNDKDNDSTTKPQEPPAKQETNKENSSNAGSATEKNDDLMDTDDEQDSKSNNNAAERKRSAESLPNSDKKPKKRVIEEDSDEEEEEEEFQPNDAEDNDHADQDEDMAEEEEPIEKEPAAKKSVNAVLKAPKAKPAKGAKKSELAAHAMKSNDDLLDNESVTWKDSVSYAAVCETFEAIDEISGRLEIQQRLTELFRRVLLRNPKDLYQLIYLASNTVAPAYECVELGVGDSILIKAIGEAYGSNPKMIKKKYETEGDLGTVAKTSKGKQRTLGFGAKPKPLLAKEVLQVLREIAQTAGSKSQQHKVNLIKKLLVRAQGPEAKYIIRALQGKLRIGLAQSTVLVALAHAVTLTPPEGVDNDADVSDDAPEEAIQYANSKTPLDKRLEAAVAIMKKAYSEVPSYDSLLDAALSVPLQEMYKACTLTPGCPVTPMLAKPTKSIQEVLKRLNGLRFTCEFKYDGERAQVHMKSDGTTSVFSRSLLDTTGKFPEVPLYVKEACKESGVDSFVLDTEVVAYNRETQQFVPFQVLSTRKKSEESAESAKVQVIVQAFDLMYLNGKSLLNATLAERRKLMKENFKPVEGKFQFATSVDHTEDGDTAILEEFLETAVKGKCEGLMVKTLDVHAVYEPSRRSLNWLKLKKDYLEGLGDSVDLVPLGAFHGKGKRTGFYGAYLLACYDNESEEFQSVCKIGTGFSDENLKSLTESFKEHIVSEKPSEYNVTDQLECDVWFDAVQVWEVKAADLSKSSAHRGAVGRVGEPDRGIGLRFPRFERIRPDKLPVEATSSEQILEMYYQQDSVQGNGGAGDDDDDDGI